MKTRGLLSGPFLALALAAAGCLTASQEARVSTDLAEVRSSVFQLQRDSASVLQRITALEEAFAKQQSAGPTRYADLQALIQTLTDEVRALGARLDDNAVRMTALSREVTAARDQYRAVEARLATVMAAQGMAAGAAGPPATPGTTPAGAGAPGVPPPAANPGGTAAPLASATQGSNPASAAAPAGLTTGNESAQEEAFRAAYTEFTRGNYDAAIAGFDEFLRRYPASPLAGKTHYYRGESLYSQQRYQEAADAFGRSVADQPNGDSAAAAYLKKGLSLLAMKQTAQGVVQLQHVIEAFPRSEEARVAADRLRQLGLRDR